jgi:hypothetical protein
MQFRIAMQHQVELHKLNLLQSLKGDSFLLKEGKQLVESHNLSKYNLLNKGSHSKDRVKPLNWFQVKHKHNQQEKL